MLPLALLLGLLLVPVLEIYVILQVGGLIGGWPTVGLLVAETLLGGWIVRREGRRAWRTLTEAVAHGTMPERELSDAALVLVGGVLLLTPGFVTDLLGFLFVLPFTRPLVRRALAAYATRRMRPLRTGADLGFPGPQESGGPSSEPRVVRGEVVSEEERPAGRA